MSGIPSSNLGSMRVDLNLTTLEDIQAFQQEVQAKGGGEIHAVKNRDHSYTLYAPGSKPSSRGLFSKRETKAERQEKQDCAKEAVMTIIKRDFPQHVGSPKLLQALYKQKDFDAGFKPKSYVGSKPSDANPSLEDVLKDKDLRQALNDFALRERSTENLEFLSLLDKFKSATTVHQKYQLAVKIGAMINKPGRVTGPQGMGSNLGGKATVNVSDKQALLVHQSLSQLTQAYLTKSPNLAASMNAFSDAVVGSETNPSMTTAGLEIFKLLERDSFSRFTTSPELQSAVDKRLSEFAAAHLDAAKLGEVLGEMNGVVSEKVASKEETLTKQFKTANYETYLENEVMYAALSKHAGSHLSGENFSFMDGLAAFEAESDPQEKLAIATQLGQMIDRPGAPPNANQTVNISGRVATHFHNQLAALVTANQSPTGMSAADLQALDQLFNGGQTPNSAGAKQEVTSLINRHIIPTFAQSPEFKAAIREARLATEENPASILAPGSGQAFIDRVIQAKGFLPDFSNANVGELRANPAMKAAFEAYCISDHSSENTDFLNLVDDFEAAATPAAKLALANQIATLVHNPAVPAPTLSFGGTVAITVPVAMETQFHQTLASLNTAMQQNQSLTPAEQATLEGIFDQGLKKQVVSLLNRDVVPRFRKSSEYRAGSQAAIQAALPAIRKQRLPEVLSDKVTQRAVAREMFQEQMEVKPNDPQNNGWERFANQSLEGSGGATGSGRARVGNQLYQVKGSIAHAGLGRRIKAHSNNAENYGEVIASNISKALIGKANQDQIPTVRLRQNGATHEAMVTSEYLRGGKGDLKAMYEKEAGGPLPKGKRHPKVDLSNTTQPSSDGVLRLKGQAVKDVFRNLALSALMGDHDVNPGNMISMADNRIGRIDFGHAFNELIGGFSNSTVGRWIFGGGTQVASNRVLDFFNRESINGMPLTGQSTPKLWRDYDGVGPSFEMSEALKDTALSQDLLEGLATAKHQFADLMAALQLEGTPEAEAQLADFVASFKQISENLHAPIDETEPSVVLQKAFVNIQKFVEKGMSDMFEVATLCELQAKIDQHTSMIGKNPQNLDQVLDQLCDQFADDYQLISEGRNTLLNERGEMQWMKSSAKEKAFQGSLRDYLRHQLTA